MASQLKVDTLTGVTTAGSISVTGEGNSTTTNLQQGLAKAWVNFNGTGTIATRDSLNHSSLTDHGAGNYTSTISSAMGNTNYAVSLANAQGIAASTNSAIGIMTTGTAGDDALSTYSTTAQRVVHRVSSGSSQNLTLCNISIHGDLA